MKIINHQKGNFQYCGESVMYGTIQMTQNEWASIYEYLRGLYFQESIHETDMYLKMQLEVNGQSKQQQPNSYFCLGVSVTKKLFSSFNLKGYKHQNYQIHITA